MKFTQIVGSMLVAVMLGGCVAVAAQEWLHLSSFLSGVLATLSGMMPAAISAAMVTRRVMKEAGLSPADVAETLQLIQQERQAATAAEKEGQA